MSVGESLERVSKRRYVGIGEVPATIEICFVS